MAKLASITSGNFTSSSTWGVINEQSFQTGGLGGLSYSVTTTPTSLGTFSPATTVTATHVGFRLLGTGPTGTLTFDIFNVTAGAQVAGTSVTINKSALNFNSANGIASWYLVKIPTPPSLSSGTNYAIRVSNSVGSSSTNIYAITNGLATSTHRFIVTSNPSDIVTMVINCWNSMSDEMYIDLQKYSRYVYDKYISPPGFTDYILHNHIIK